MPTNDTSVQVKFLTAGANWVRIGSMLALGLTGYHEPLGAGSTVSVHTMNTGASCIAGLDLVDRGIYDFGMSSPPWLALAAANGIVDLGWDRRSLNLSAVCSFPHDDQLVLAVRRDLGIKSLHQVRDKKIPLRLSTGPLHLAHPLGVVLDLVLSEYGIATDDFERWGGGITFADRQLNVLAEGPADRKDRVSSMRSGELDGVFDEGIMSKTWKDIADTVDLEYLPIDDDVLDRLESKYGVRRSIIPKGRLRGVEQDIPTVDFAGWLLYCRSNLPENLVYLTMVALEEQKAQLESLFEPQRPFQGLSELPLNLSTMGRDTALPLHPGAEAYFRERGSRD
jgi:TRAP-type uncharacterized transport system substrate-binding protein